MVLLAKADVILTHESDLDGFVSGVLLNGGTEVFDIDVPLEAYHYNTCGNGAERSCGPWVCDLILKHGWTSRTGW